MDPRSDTEWMAREEMAIHERVVSKVGLALKASAEWISAHT